MSVPTVLLVIVLLGVLAMVAYRLRPGRDRAPFALFHIAPGMSMKELQSTVAKVRGSKLSCRADEDVGHYCDVLFANNPGSVVALLDSHDRVIVVEAGAIVGRPGLRLESEKETRAWSRVASPVAVAPMWAEGDTGAVRWTSPDRRWTAELQYSVNVDEGPYMALLVDAETVGSLAQASDHWAYRAKESGWIPWTREELDAAEQQLGDARRQQYDSMPAMLSVLREKQAGYWSQNHHYASNVSDLDGMPSIGNTEVRILSATDSGWTAEALDRRFPGITCVTLGGQVPQDQWPWTAGGARTTLLQATACDPLPPSTTSTSSTR